MNTPTTHGQKTKRTLPPELLYSPQKKNRAIIIFQWAVIIIAGGGFTFKFVEFTLSVLATGNELVNFAITPLVMYVCVALGFFLLFMWTVLRGDYKDIERPKFRLFERELELDQAEEEEIERRAALESVLSIPLSHN